jgi:hypothetical protein
MTAETVSGFLTAGIKQVLLPSGLTPLNGELIDDLVADIIATEGKHVEVSRQAIERLTTQYPALAERYGDPS